MALSGFRPEFILCCGGESGQEHVQGLAPSMPQESCYLIAMDGGTCSMVVSNGRSFGEGDRLCHWSPNGRVASMFEGSFQAEKTLPPDILVLLSALAEISF